MTHSDLEIAMAQFFDAASRGVLKPSDIPAGGLRMEAARARPNRALIAGPFDESGKSQEVEFTRCEPLAA